MSANAVHFTPGARTAWHTHPNGQTIFVLEGIGRAGSAAAARSRRSGPGDRVFFEPGEEHWHGAAPESLHAPPGDRQRVDDQGNSATWLKHVTEEEYLVGPSG